MDFVGLYRIESPFSFAAAIVPIRVDGASALGECFVFVMNRRSFIGFQRVRLSPGLSFDEAQERMRQEVRRVHAKMCSAAKRKGLLPESHMHSADSRLYGAPANLVSDLWSARGFAEFLDWIGKTTASASLRAEIDNIRASGDACR